MGHHDMSLVPIGSRFSHWTVIDRWGGGWHGGKQQCLCRCDCGTELVICAAFLRRGATNQCIRCGLRFARMHRKPSHGNAPRSGETSEYTSWRAMKQRTTNPNHSQAKWYFDRGITICHEWRGKEGFAKFLAHIGPKPDKRYTVERIDNNGNYEPGNVRWATMKEQAQNTSKKKRTIRAFGEKLTTKEWSERYGVDIQTIGMRLRHKWPAELAVSREKCRGKPGIPGRKSK